MTDDDDAGISEAEAAEAARHALQNVATDQPDNSDDSDDAGSDPFECPRCGARRVKARGDGAKDCQTCPWEYRPSTDDTSQQVGLDGF